MKFLELAKQRFSCRNYLPKAISQDVLMQVIEAGRIAPSACNYQPWLFKIITESVLLEKLFKTYPREWLKTAPAVIVIIGDHSKSWKRKDGKDHLDIDVAIAIDHMTLQATELGLATCWVCNFDAIMYRQLFNMAAHLEPIAFLPIGYAADKVDINRHEIKREMLDSLIYKDEL
jgi:nitroreductase